MTSNELDHLVRIGKLKMEPSSPREQRGLLDSATARLADAALGSLSFDGRFDLAYNASHALALAERLRDVVVALPASVAIAGDSA